MRLEFEEPMLIDNHVVAALEKLRPLAPFCINHNLAI
jgi:acetate kinase